MIELRVIGESRCDPGHLLVLDEDGQVWDYDLVAGEVVPVEPDETWALDPPPVAVRRPPPAEGLPS